MTDLFLNRHPVAKALVHIAVHIALLPYYVATAAMALFTVALAAYIIVQIVSVIL